METLYTYKLISPSNYKFSSIYSVKYVMTPNGQRRNILGTLYVGNPKTKDLNESCVTIVVNYPDAITEYEEKYQRTLNIDPTVASLILTKHYAKCAEDRDLVRGKGTVEMIKIGRAHV